MSDTTTIQQAALRYAFAYVRVSSDHQTLDNQKYALRVFAQKNDLVILDFFEDHAISGSVEPLKRKGFKAMVDALTAGGVDCVLVYEISRIGRTMRETFAIINELEKTAPIVSASPKEDFLQKAKGSNRDLMLSVMSWCAQQERELLIARTKEGIARYKAAGGKMGAPVKQVDYQKLMSMLKGDKETGKQYSIGTIAKELGVSRPQIYVILKRMNVQTGRRYVLE